MQVFQPNENVDMNVENKIQSVLDEPCQLEFLINKFIKFEIYTTIMKSIKAKKNPGYDLITGRILQELQK